MIQNFVHSGLRDLFLHGASTSIPFGIAGPCRQRLFVLDGATCDADIRISGLTVRASLARPGMQEIPFMNRRILFRWNGADADHVDLA